MEVRDVRRMAATVMLVVVAVLAWLALLAAHTRGPASWGLAERGLGFMPLATWAWTGLAVVALLSLFLALVVFGVDVLPSGWHQGAVRQVQCEHCRAVFLLNDTGYRPLTHQCPNCHYLGIYDGTRQPVGDEHRRVARRDAVLLALRCRTCKERFQVTDSGVRPLKVECPNCQTVGRLL